MKRGYIYILSNKNRTTLYIGITNNLERRVLEHKSGNGSVF
ncbi:MAG: GIY-YIG nuclease family protein, partial [Bacteroidota bacterium]|nr:GIY-YIG nuclease family protein [Bacteroidota bacterium]